MVDQLSPQKMREIIEREHVTEMYVQSLMRLGIQAGVVEEVIDLLAALIPNDTTKKRVRQTWEIGAGHVAQVWRACGADMDIFELIVDAAYDDDAGTPTERFMRAFQEYLAGTASA